MGTKRTHSAMEGVHPSRHAQVSEVMKPPKIPRRMGPPAYQKKGHSSSAIKKRIRDIKRRLERSHNLPAMVQVEDERALVAYEQELAAAVEEKARQKMIKKYHMVRFFERQKATRHLKKLRKRLLMNESKEEVAIIKVKMHVAEVDLNYTRYFPLNRPYISLYPQKNVGEGESGGQDDVTDDTSKKPSIWTEVEKRMVDGTLEELRDGISATVIGKANIRSLQPVHGKSKPISTQAKAEFQANDTTTIPLKGLKRPQKHSSNPLELGMVGRGEKHSHDEATDDESEGGFFEE